MAKVRFVVAVLVLLLAEKIVLADPPITTKPKLKVNVLAGVNATDAEIKEMVKKANETLAQAGITYDLDPNISRGVSDGGNNDGKLQQGEVHNLDKKGQEEADKLYGKGKGVKIYIANEILDDPNAMGYAGHVKVNSRGKVVGKRVIYIKKDSDPNFVEDMGPTLAHESGHLFTLGDKGPIDSAKGKYSDANGHTTEPNNVMNEIIDPNNNKLTPEQIKEIQEGAKRMCASIKQVEMPNIGQACVVSTMPQIVGGWSDLLGESPLEYVDLDSGSIYAANIAANLEISIILNGSFPPTPISGLTYSINLDVDNNPATGVPVQTLPGVDKIITLELSGIHPQGMITARIEDTIEMTTEYLPFVSTGSLKHLVDYRGKPPVAQIYTDCLYVEVPMALLGDVPINIVNGLIISHDNISGQTDNAEFVMENTFLMEPQIELPMTKIEPFKPIAVSGMHFTPNAVITVSINDAPIGTALSDGFGNFSDVFNFNPLVLGIDFPDFYCITAQDMNAKSDYSTVLIVPNIADLNLDTEVNFEDFAIFANNWLLATEI